MTRCAAFLLAAAAAAAAPSIEDRGGALHVKAEGYSAVLSPGGALLEAGPAYRADSAEAWVAKRGAEWIPASALEAAHASRTEQGNLLVEFTLRGRGLSSAVTYYFRDAEFTATATIANAEGADIELVAFPGPMRFEADRLRHAVFPFARGVVLRPPFFADPKARIGTGFPGGFTDFVHFETADGTLAISELVPAEVSRDSIKRLDLAPDEGEGRRTFAYHADRRMALAAGGAWKSGTMLFQPGRGAADAALKHWELGASRRFPKLAAKMPAELFRKLAKAPLLKYPEGVPFREFGDRLAELPRPSLLHIAGTMPGGHDASFPDYLPPDPKYGTTDDFRTLARRARDAGHLTMPYTNPTWWDPESLTMKALGPGAAIREEKYGRRRGVAVSPWHPGVRARHQRTADEFSRIVPADFLFEDQVGAREAIEDTAAAAPSRFAYIAGIVENARESAARIPTFTEAGWDRLAEFSSGFCGNGRLDWEEPPGLAPDMWEPWPLQQILAAPHTAAYPHNLAGERMVHDAEELFRAAAFGSNLAFDLNRGTAWLATVAEFQRRVFSHTFGVAVAAFEDRRPDLGWTRLRFADGTAVLANWKADAPLAEGAYSIAPRGFLWRNADGSLAAGIFADGIAIIENGRRTDFPPPPGT